MFWSKHTSCEYFVTYDQWTIAKRVWHPKKQNHGKFTPKICSRLLNSLSWLYCKMFLKFLWDFLKTGGKTKGQMYRSPLSVKSEKAEKQLDCLGLGMWGWRAAALQSLQACSGSVKVQCLGTQHPSEQSHLDGCWSQSAHSVCVCVFSALVGVCCINND